MDGVDGFGIGIVGESILVTGIGFGDRTVERVVYAEYGLAIGVNGFNNVQGVIVAIGIKITGGEFVSGHAIDRVVRECGYEGVGVSDSGAVTVVIVLVSGELAQLFFDPGDAVDRVVRCCRRVGLGIDGVDDVVGVVVDELCFIAFGIADPGLAIEQVVFASGGITVFVGDGDRGVVQGIGRDDIDGVTTATGFDAAAAPVVFKGGAR